MSYSPLFRGAAANAPANSTATGYQNGTVSTIAVATAVSTNTSGQMILTDVSNETTVEAWLGLASQSTPTTANGLVVSDGRLQNIPMSLGFSVGDPIWVGFSPGSLTNVKPDLSVPGWSSGYFVLFVGVVVQNEFNPSEQDIQLCRQLIGQL
jgi:uncharacterized protein YbaA (DUF1428 family)